MISIKDTLMMPYRRKVTRPRPTTPLNENTELIK